MGLMYSEHGLTFSIELDSIWAKSYYFTYEDSCLLLYLKYRRDITFGNYGLSSHQGKMKISEIKSHANLENEFAMIYGYEKGKNELSKFHNGYKR